MFKLVKNIFDYNKKEVDKISKIVAHINELEPKAQALKDTDFKKETESLKKAYSNGEKTLDDMLPWAYALTREAAQRVLGMRHYDEQLIAGVALHRGMVAEQKTGEGKTLSATAPAYLNALTGKGVHMVTVNDYLARRDAGWMGQVYDFLGLTVSSIISDRSYIFDQDHLEPGVSDWRLINLRTVSRKQAYEADITFGINSEFGFDYLRDNMAKSSQQLVQRGFHYAIIDEVDSVLIDEARTPHIISAPYTDDVSKYYEYARLTRNLKENDYIIDEKMRTAHLTEEGITNLEKAIGVDNIYEQEYDTLFHIEAALKAHALFKKDKDYIVREGEIIIVDEFTGRLLEGRRYSEGLHQAIEAKENVEIKRESRTLATVSLQNYFRMYEKLAGMTGTAETEAEEFKKIYDMDTLVLPTHRPVVRQDYPDLIYKTQEAKFNAVVEEIAKQYATGRPVLVGTSSIDKNEYLSHLLKKKGIDHQVLNAKNHEREAQIIADAGKKGSITVATNMAGRGVDIVLGGEPPNRFVRDEDRTQAEIDKEFAKEMEIWQKRHDEVVELGGLFVLSTEKHESRRIDNQLRGRAGRQGDPGDSRFFVSLEDDLMRIFGGDQVTKLMNFFNLPEDQPLEHAMVTRALEQAQVKVEGFNFDTRKNLVEYDDVLNKQREILYKKRQHILYSDDPDKSKRLYEEVSDSYEEQLLNMLNVYVFSQPEPDYESLAQELDVIFPESADEIIGMLQSAIGEQEVQGVMMKAFEDVYKRQQDKAGESAWQSIVRFLFLDTIDKKWTEHLTAIDDLRQGINLRGYAQLDPLTEYKNEAFSMFEMLLSSVNYDVVRRIAQIKVEENTEKELEEAALQESEQNLKFESASGKNAFKVDQPQIGSSENSHSGHSHAGHSHNEQKGFKVRTPGPQEQKPGRNDACWCGSGKKYKKCHYPD